jgi:hypothetical protein
VVAPPPPPPNLRRDRESRVAPQTPRLLVARPVGLLRWPREPWTARETAVAVSEPAGLGVATVSRDGTRLP